MVGVYYSEPKREKSARRAQRRLAAVADPDGGQCLLAGCSRPTQATAGKGFSRTHCHYHVQRMNRHGSYWKGTYGAAHLMPYRAAAARHIKHRPNDVDMQVALHGLLDLLNWGGRRVAVLELRRQDTETKARAALWRLREAGVLPVKLLASHLAITAAVRDEMLGGEEYRIVQVAKAAVRMASGYHHRYSWGGQLDAYPRSGGRFLRVLGEKLDGACGAWVKANAYEVQESVRKARLGSIDLSQPLK